MIVKLSQNLFQQLSLTTIKQLELTEKVYYIALAQKDMLAFYFIYLFDTYLITQPMKNTGRLYINIRFGGFYDKPNLQPTYEP